jgi:prepilin-type N-terminal cleavage/methylation domain-containing protein
MIKQTPGAIGRLKGFTLVEILVALGILSIVLAALFSAFRAGIFGSRAIDEKIAMYQTAKLILERVNLDLRNAVIYSPEKTGFSGNATDMSFVAVVDVFEKGAFVSDYAIIKYRIEDTAVLRPCLRGPYGFSRSVSVQPDEISGQIETMRFQYGSISLPGKPLEWKEAWDDPKTLPQAVKAELRMKDKGIQPFERTIYLSLNEAGAL